MLFNSRIALGIILALLGACAQPEAPQDLAKVPDTSPVVRDQKHWPVVHQAQAHDRSVTLEKSVMPEEDQRAIRNEFKSTDLQALPIDSKYNVNLFKIHNVPDYENAVFVAPRLYAYSSADGARLAPRRNRDGTMSISFPVVLTSGDSAKIQSPNATGVIEIPEFLRMQNRDELEVKVKEVYGQKKFISRLNGCPKKITVVVGNEEHDATPSDLAKGDYCEQDTPFTVTVKLPETEALHLLQEALYAGIVDVRAVYETRVAYSNTRFKLEFDKTKLFEELSAALSIQAAWADIDARMKVTEVVQRKSMKVQIQGEMNAPLTSIVDQAILSFFTPFRPDPNTTQKECDGKPVCLRLNYNYSKETQTFSVEWLQSTNVMTGQNYLTWTKLKALEDSGVRIEKLSNKNTGFGTSRESGLTVI